MNRPPSRRVIAASAESLGSPEYDENVLVQGAGRPCVFARSSFSGVGVPRPFGAFCEGRGTAPAQTRRARAVPCPYLVPLIFEAETQRN